MALRVVRIVLDDQGSRQPIDNVTNTDAVRRELLIAV
jgi:hypothetical protein